jgi:hypothetical protein
MNEREEGDQRGADLAHDHGDPDHLVRVGRRTGLERRLDRVEQRADTLAQRLRPELRAPRPDLVEEGGQVAERGPELHERGGDDEYRDTDDRREERCVDDEDRQATPDPGPRPDHGHERLERRPEQHGDEDQQDDIARRRQEPGEHEHGPDPDGEPRSPCRPAE